MIGKTLGERYKISEKIGGGGMADVYKAHDNKLEREVAIKILKREFINDYEFVDKFKKESHAAAKLNHPNIVGIYDVGSEIVDGETVYYIVMEIVEGITLKELIKNKGHLSVKETIYYTLQIADALINAHYNHIVHRDIKPQNIIINNDNVAKVTDFGIAKAANNVTVTSNNDILGSVHYFSPEQARGENTDQRSDIYSLGICMYEMLTGELPFDAENPISIALMQVQEPIKKPSAIYSNIPSELDKIVMKMTEKEKVNRYSNLKSVVEDIKNLEVVQDMDIAETIVLPKIQNTNAEIRRDVSVDEQRRIRRSSTSSKKRTENIEKPERRPTKGSAGKSFFSILAGILVALVVATGGFYLFFNWWNTRPVAKEIEVPNIIGVQEEEAKKIVEGRGLQFEVSERLINHDFKNNDVIYQSVSGGEKVKEGYKIRVTINDLPETLSVEDYTGKKFDDISKELKEKGFLVETKFIKVDDEKDIGKVLEQSPDVGSEVKLGSTLKLTIGKESEVKTVKVPDIKGLKIDEAKEILEGKNLKVGEILEDYSDKYDKKDIMKQSVKPEEEVEEGTKIDLTVVIGNLEDKENTESENEKPEEEQEEKKDPESEDITKIAIGIPIPQDREKTTVKIIKLENGKKEVIYEKEHKAEESAINITVEGSKDATYELYYDDSYTETYP